MSALSECREYLIEIVKGAGGVNTPSTYVASVNSVNEAARTCSCALINGPSDMSLDTVLLMSEVNDGLLVIPAVDSTVIVQGTPNSLPVVIMFSQIDKVISIAGGSTLQIDSDGLKLDGDKYGGVMQITPSVKAWNDLQNDVNNLKSILQQLSTLAASAVTSSPGSPDAFAVLFVTAFATYPSQTLTLTQKSDLENTKVQHGDGS